jgi:hypothetical protein
MDVEKSQRELFYSSIVILSISKQAYPRFLSHVYVNIDVVSI